MEGEATLMRIKDEISGAQSSGKKVPAERGLNSAGVKAGKT
jgi:hypothetical protein